MQYLNPVGFGPSSKTWPRWPPQRRQWTAVRSMPSEVSSVVPTALSSGAQKLGQPVPLSNFVVDEKRSSAQPAHANTPALDSCSSGLENGGSVSSSRSTAYCSGVRSLCHSPSPTPTTNGSLG